jgi:hypothetical protein
VLATMLGLDVTGVMTWIIYVIGGVIGLILVSFLFDWALITLSSLAGASLIIQAFFPQGQGATGGLVFFILFIVGVLIQGSILRRERAMAVVE